MTLSIQQIKLLLHQKKEVDEEFISMLQGDERKGVHLLLKQYHSRKKKQEALERMFKQMSEYECELRLEGYSLIAGIDEAGRGPLAGPVVAAAVILPSTFKLLGLTDSKKVSKQNRLDYSKIIKKEAIAYSIQMIHAEEIDRVNIYQATKLAMTKAVVDLKEKPDHLLIDAMSLRIPIPQTSLIKGDLKSITIAAGSILAKVARDDYMEMVSQKFPGYGFESHVGYGTKEHMEALDNQGLTPEHRRSFQPIREREKS